MTREDDLISRRIIKEQMLKYGFTAPDMTITEFVEDCLPSAQPERKKGKWIHHTDWEHDGECGYECSVCGMGSDVDYDFCMRCGADMRTSE